MSILNDLQYAVYDVLRTYIDEYGGMGTVPKDQQEQLNALNQTLRNAICPVTLRRLLIGYVNEVPVVWRKIFVLLPGNKLRKRIEDVVMQPRFWERNLYKSMYVRQRERNQHQAQLLNSELTQQYLALEKAYQDIRRQCVQQQAEIKRLQQENHFLMRTIGELDEERTQLRQGVMLAQQLQVDTPNESGYQSVDCISDTDTLPMTKWETFGEYIY